MNIQSQISSHFNRQKFQNSQFIETFLGFPSVLAPLFNSIHCLLRHIIVKHVLAQTIEFKHILILICSGLSNDLLDISDQNWKKMKLEHRNKLM